MLEPGSVLDGYQILRRIGVGGFGEVFLCRNEITTDYRALKFISASSSALAEKELQALVQFRNAGNQIRSPFLVSIEHVGRTEAGLFYVMPLADGLGADDPLSVEWRPYTLEALLDIRRSDAAWFTSRQIIELFSPILDALGLLSQAGLVHRDVKPANILFFNNLPCLGDIGLVGEDSAEITRRGTPGYLPPSWYEGGYPDMYGAAAVLYTLLTGNLPDKIGRANFRWPPQGEKSLSANERLEWLRLHRVITRALHEKSNERFVDFESFKHALMPGSKDSAPSKRKRYLASIAGGIVLITAVSAIFISRSHFPSNSAGPTSTEVPAKTDNAAIFRAGIKDFQIQIDKFAKEYADTYPKFYQSLENAQTLMESVLTMDTVDIKHLNESLLAALHALQQSINERPQLSLLAFQEKTSAQYVELVEKIRSSAKTYDQERYFRDKVEPQLHAYFTQKMHRAPDDRRVTVEANTFFDILMSSDKNQLSIKLEKLKPPLAKDARVILQEMEELVSKLHAYELGG